MSTVRGVLTRSIWMSLGSFALPTPTVKTGSFSAFRFSSVLVSEPSLVSAPSVTSTMPATGSPASSSRTPSSAAPIFVCDPPNVRSFTEFTRPAVDEKRNVAHEELVRQRLHQRAGAGGQLLAQELRARLVVEVGDLHAARVVEQHGDDVLLRDGGLDDQRRPEETEDDERQRGHAQRGQDDPVARAAVRADAAVGDDGADHDDRGDARGHERGGRDVEAEVALLEDDGPIGEERLEESFEHRLSPPSPEP